MYSSNTTLPETIKSNMRFRHKLEKAGLEIVQMENKQKEKPLETLESIHQLHSPLHTGTRQFTVLHDYHNKKNTKTQGN